MPFTLIFFLLWSFTLGFFSICLYVKSLSLAIIYLLLQVSYLVSNQIQALRAINEVKISIVQAKRYMSQDFDQLKNCISFLKELRYQDEIVKLDKVLKYANASLFFHVVMQIMLLVGIAISIYLSAIKKIKSQHKLAVKK